MLSEKLKSTNNSAYIFHKMLDAVPISMLLVDLGGNIVFANRYTEQLFGYDQTELLTKRVESLIPERFRGSHASYREIYMKLPKIRAMGLGRDLFGLRIDGSEVPIEIGLTPVRIEAGFFVLASIVDIAEREYVKSKFLSEEIKTAKLETVNEQLAEFSHIVSHDLSDPFLKIEAFFPKVCNSGSDLEASNIINKAVNKGKTLIQDLLIYAQSSSLQIEEVDMMELVKEVIELYPNNLITADNLVTLQGDKVLLRQIWSNLISNAVKYGNGKPIHIGATNGAFYIKDEGIGIAKEHLVNLFKPFHRIHPKDRYPGTGLGLVICKKAVERHGGKIWINSELGSGTTVYFTVPLVPLSRDLVIPDTILPPVPIPQSL